MLPILLYCSRPDSLLLCAWASALRRGEFDKPWLDALWAKLPPNHELKQSIPV